MGISDAPGVPAPDVGIRNEMNSRHRPIPYACNTSFGASAANVSKGAISVGQEGILRGDWQSPRVPVANRHAACQAVSHGPAAHGIA